jgi:hypothetical protein
MGVPHKQHNTLTMVNPTGAVVGAVSDMVQWFNASMVVQCLDKEEKCGNKL